ncbi:MAG: carotenoid oxygenase family protein [Actinomycetota bacterium]|nr:carotenoid oxygenase family protein [Actinomycetota bacterium]
MAPWSAGLETVTRELAGIELDVQGDLPSWLRGTLIRNGPADFDAGGRRLRHWFDGFAMLHAFSVTDGAVSYSNRYLETQAYRAARDHGRIAFKEFATDPCRSIFKRATSLFSPHPTDNANVNVARLGGKFVAMTETPMSVEFDPVSLRTAGIIQTGDDLPTNLTTAHPHFERETGDGVSYALRFSLTSTYVLYRHEATGRRVPIAQLPVREPAYMHSFGITDNYIVLAEFPLLLNPLRLLLSGRPFIENYRWKPDRGTRFHVVDRRTGELHRTVVAPPFFAFHHVNAFEQEGEVVVDIVAFDDASVIDDLYLAPLRGEEPFEHALPQLRRYRLGPGAAEPEALSHDPFELPRINYTAHNARPYSYVYGAGLDATNFLDRLVKVDTTTGASKTWKQEGCFPGEPVFVAAPEAGEEDAGIILSVVLDATTATSFLLVLDAASFAVVARADVPQPVPFGFHGTFFGETSQTPV